MTSGRTGQGVQLLFYVWCVLFAAVLAALSLDYPAVAGLWGQKRLFGLVVCGMLDLLAVFALVSGRADWLGGISRKEAERAGIKACRSCAFCQLLCFAAATFGYVGYCVLDQRFWHWGNEIRHCLVAAGMLVAAWYVSNLVHFFLFSSCILKKNKYNE